MYIPEFWVGVICTILSEIVIVLLLSMWATWKDKDTPEKTKKKEIERSREDIWR